MNADKAEQRGGMGQVTIDVSKLVGSTTAGLRDALIRFPQREFFTNDSRWAEAADIWWRKIARPLLLTAQRVTGEVG